MKHQRDVLSLEDRRALREKRGIPTCPECLDEMPKIGPGPIRAGGWTPSRCTACGRLWKVYVADGDVGRRVTGYELRLEGDLAAEEGETIMPTTTNKTTIESPKANNTAMSARVQKGIDKAKAKVEKTRAKAETAIGAKEKKAAAKTAKAEAKAAGEKEKIMTFAMRLTVSESAEIHRAAGPGKASQFVKGLALAAARGDGDALQKIVEVTLATGR